MRHVHEARSECQVVNEQLIREGIQIDDEAVASPEEKRQNMALADVESLSLSFRNVVAIEYLHGLHALKKLQLDNNQLMTVQNLDALVNLEWLDLSFNRIERIEGLENLIKLTDLSLFDNRITKIENMDSLTRLQILSIGNNQISHLEDIDYLRRFKGLRVLRISENPLCKVEGFRSYILSRLDGLKSLDYKAICQADIDEAKEHHQDELLEISEREEKQLELEAKEEEEWQENEKMSRANLAGIGNLFKNMEQNDPDWQRLKHIPAVAELWNDTKTKFNSSTEDFKTVILEIVANMEAETEIWHSSLASYMRSKTDRCRALISDFEKEKKQLLKKEMIDRLDRASSLKTKVMQLKKMFMMLAEEMRDIRFQFNQKYEASLTALSSKKTSLYAMYFTQIRDLLNGCNSALNSAALGALEKLHSEGDSGKMPEEALQLLNDKDVLLTLLQSSQDYRASHIDTIEDECCQKENVCMQQHSEQLSLQEKKHHRDLLSEMLAYIEYNMIDVETISD